MPQTIKLKRSATAGQVPTVGQLDLGELAINTTDGKLFLRKADGTTDVILEINGSISATSSKVTTNGVAPTDPAPVEGDLWFDTTKDVLMYYDGTGWKEAANHLYGDLRVDGSTILGDDPATDTLVVNSLTSFTGTDGMTIPSGTTGQRVTANTGTIRYNTDTSSFEGYSGTSWGSLGGVKDVDQDTYLTTESAAGADEDTFTFVAGGTTLGTWDAVNGLTINTAMATNGGVTVESGDAFTFGQGANRTAFTDVTNMTVSNEAGTIIFNGFIMVP